MEKILLFIPMYNCEKQIVRVLSQFDDHVCKLISEVIIVNNRSTDDGEKAVINYINNSLITVPIALIRNDENYSLGGSHKVAFNYAIDNHFDYIVVLHGDDQGNIHDLLPYIKSGRALKYDSFLGSRFEKDSKLQNYSLIRILGNHVFNIVMSGILGRRVTDLGSGLNMYRVDYLRSKFYMGFINSLTFNVYMLMYGSYAKSNFRFFPLTWREDDQVSNAKFVKQSMEILKLMLRYILSRKKLFTKKENEYSKKAYTSKIIFENDARKQIGDNYE